MNREKIEIDPTLIAYPPVTLAAIVDRFTRLPISSRADQVTARYYHREIEHSRPAGGHQAGDAAHQELRTIHIEAAQALAVPASVDQNLDDLDRVLSLPLRSTRMPRWSIHRMMRRLVRLLPLVAVIALGCPTVSYAQGAVVVVDPDAEANLAAINGISAVLRAVQMATQDTTGNIWSALGVGGGLNSNSPFSSSILQPIQGALAGTQIVIPGTPLPLFATGNSSQPASYYSSTIAPSMPSNPLNFGQQQTFAANLFYSPPSASLTPVDIANRQQIRMVATRQAAVDSLAIASATAASEPKLEQVAAGLNTAMSQTESLRQDVSLNTQALLLAIELAIRTERIELARLKLEAARQMVSDPNMSAAIVSGASQ